MLHRLVRRTVLAEAPGGLPQVIVLATGSEVALAVAAREQLAAQGIAVRVVSMPSTEVFDRQEPAYVASVLPRGIPRLAVEAGVPDYWRKYVGLDGEVIGVDRFGESAPAAEVFKLFQLTADHVAARARALAAGLSAR